MDGMITVSDQFLQRGRELLVRYEGENHFHRRVLISPATAQQLLEVTGEAHTGGPIWWVVTPDMDVYPEELCLGPLIALAGCTKEDGEWIHDSAVGEVRFRRVVRDFTSVLRPGAFVEILESVLAHAVPDDVAVGVAPAGAVPATAPVGSFFKLGSKCRMPLSNNGWTVHLSEDASAVGGELSGMVDEYCLGSPYGLVRDAGVTHIVSSGAAPPAVKPPGAAVGLDVAKADDDEDLDVRVLTLSRDGDGNREKSYRECVAQCTESEWGNWPIQGPRTVRWCMKYILDSDHHPKARHARWRRDAQLSGADAGVSEHEMLLKCLDVATSYDQLNVSELAVFELIMRRVQLIELKHRERIVGQSEYGEDDYLYMGAGSTRGLLMICPSLEEHVSGQMQREGAVMKERRKLQEERVLSRAGGRQRGKGRSDADVAAIPPNDGGNQKAKNKAKA